MSHQPSIANQLRELQTHARHWRYIYHRRRGWHGVSTRQIIASQLFTVIASVLAGLLLDITKENIAILAGALLLLPGIIDLAASLTGAMCAKIHHQLDGVRVHAWLVVVHAVLFAILVGVIAGTLVGVVGGGIAAWLFDASFTKIVMLSVVSMSIIGIVVTPGMALFTLLVRQMGYNPDNMSGPVESSVVDVVAILTVAGVASWLA